MLSMTIGAAVLIRTSLVKADRPVPPALPQPARLPKRRFCFNCNQVFARLKSGRHSLRPFHQGRRMKVL
jgi:hypothetical protein